MAFSLASLEEVPGIQTIYNEYVNKSVFTFDVDPPDHSHWSKKISKSHVFLVSSFKGKVIAFAYASEHRQKAAYRWVCETTIYIHPDYLNKGIGSPLYSALLDILEVMNYRIALAGITRPNPRSEAFHQKLGFKKKITYENIGYKNDQWLSVDWYNKELYSVQRPKEILTLEQIGEERVQSILSKHSNSINTFTK